MRRNLFPDFDTPVGRRQLDAIDAALGLIMPDKPEPDHDRFFRHFERIRRFNCDQTGLTPPMGYLLYELARSSRADVAAVGVHAGVSAGFITAGAYESPYGIQAVSIEPDRSCSRIASANLASLGIVCAPVVLHADPVVWANNQDRALGMVFIDVLHPVRQKADYTTIARNLLPDMPSQSIMVGHDAFVARWRDDLEGFIKALDESGRLERSAELPVDETGAFVGRLS